VIAFVVAFLFVIPVGNLLGLLSLQLPVGVAAAFRPRKQGKSFVGL